MGVGAFDAVWRAGVRGVAEAFEGCLFVACTAAESQASGVFEADVVGDLGFEREDLGGLLVRSVGGANLVFAGVETEAFCETHGVRAGNGSTETFDGREDLFVEIVLDVGSETRVGFEDVLGSVGTFGCWVRFGLLVAHCDDVRHDIVDSNVLASSDLTKSDLDLRHRFRVRIGFGIFPEFLCKLATNAFGRIDHLQCR